MAGHRLTVAGKSGARHGAHFGHAAQIDSCSSVIPCRSLARSLSLSPFMSHYVVCMPVVFIGACLAEGGGDGMWAAIFLITIQRGRQSPMGL